MATGGRWRSRATAAAGRWLSETYRVPTGSAAPELREKGSRFLAFVAPRRRRRPRERSSTSSAPRTPTRRTTAWPGGSAGRRAERAADDGEPAGTAGLPILRVLAGAGLSDVVAVVVRWFGGTKLGKGGLARAYAAATLGGARGASRPRDEWPATEVEIACPTSGSAR